MLIWRYGLPRTRLLFSHPSLEAPLRRPDIAVNAPKVSILFEMSNVKNTTSLRQKRTAAYIWYLMIYCSQSRTKLTLQRVVL